MSKKKRRTSPIVIEDISKSPLFTPENDFYIRSGELWYRMHYFDWYSEGEHVLFLTNARLHAFKWNSPKLVVEMLHLLEEKFKGTSFTAILLNDRDIFTYWNGGWWDMNHPYNGGREDL